MSSTRTQPGPAPSKTQPGATHESADSHGHKSPAGPTNILMRLVDVRTASANDEVAEASVQQSAKRSSDQPSSESSEEQQTPRRANRSSSSSNKRRQRSERPTSAGWIRPLWQVAAGCVMVILFVAVYFVLVGSRTGEDSAGAPSEAGNSDDPLVAIEMPPEYSMTPGPLTPYTTEPLANAREHGVRLQTPQWSSPSLDVQSEAGRAPALNATPLAQQPVDKPAYPIAGSSESSTPNRKLPEGRTFYETPKVAQESAAALQYTYPVTDPSTYLYPAGSDLGAVPNRSPAAWQGDPRYDSSGSGGQPGMATLRGTIEQPQTRSR